MPEPRGRLDLPGTQNVRDLGGLPVAGGATITPGLLYRGEALVAAGGSSLLSQLDPAHAGAFAALGLATVVDLRSEAEVRASPSAWGSVTGARAVRHAIEEGGEGSDTNYVRLITSGAMATFDAGDLAVFYRDVIDRRGPVFAAVIGLFADRERLPALIHCSAGKDRTGLLVALLLDLLGTPRDMIVADYALTGRLRPNRVQAYRHLFDPLGIPLADVSALFETPASAMESTLAHLDDGYGGTAAYLARYGVDDEMRDRVLKLLST